LVGTLGESVRAVLESQEEEPKTPYDAFWPKKIRRFSALLDPLQLVDFLARMRNLNLYKGSFPQLTGLLHSTLPDSQHVLSCATWWFSRET
jgi:hypothetical protein